MRPLASTLLVLGVSAGVTLVPAAALLREKDPIESAWAELRMRLLAELASPPADSGPTQLPAALPENPPVSTLPPGPFAVRVQHFRRCPSTGDALVTLERYRGLLQSVVRRSGEVCFRLSFPVGPSGEEPQVRVTATVLPDGTAGPLAWIESLPGRTDSRGPATEKSHEEHLLVVSLEGRVLLERPLVTRSFRDGAGGGQNVQLVPLIWDGGRLLVWEQLRSWSRSADQCVGSLLTLPGKGPIEVAEGVPCTPLSLDASAGTVVVDAETYPQDSTFSPWAARVSLAGDLVPGPEPESQGPAFRFDIDGDGTPDEVYEGIDETIVRDATGQVLLRTGGKPLAGRLDRKQREIAVSDRECGVASARLDGSRRCAPGAVAGLGAVALAGASFDWTGDGTPDLTLASVLPTGGLLLAGWTEGDLTFAREVPGFEDLMPLHQAPRALSLTAAGGPEVLVSTSEGFAVLGIPSLDVRWVGKPEDGVLDAWAVPAQGASALAVR